jgi:hypothetical protein
VLGPVSKSGSAELGWLSCPGDDCGRSRLRPAVRKGRFGRPARELFGGRAGARVSALARGFLPVRGRAVALR